MVTAGPPRDDDAPVPLELYAINVLRRAHGTGLADELMSRTIGDRPAYLWVLEGTTARSRSTAGTASPTRAAASPNPRRAWSRSGWPAGTPLG